MKLLTKTNRIYLAFSLVICLLTAVSFYQIIRMVIYDEVENQLRIEKRDFEEYVRTHNSWLTIPYLVENKIVVVPARGSKFQREVFTDTLIQNRYDNELAPFRQHYVDGMHTISLATSRETYQFQASSNRRMMMISPTW